MTGLLALELSWIASGSSTRAAVRSLMFTDGYATINAASSSRMRAAIVSSCFVPLAPPPKRNLATWGTSVNTDGSRRYVHLPPSNAPFGNGASKSKAPCLKPATSPLVATLSSVLSGNSTQHFPLTSVGARRPVQLFDDASNVATNLCMSPMHRLCSTLPSTSPGTFLRPPTGISISYTDGAALFVDDAAVLFLHASAIAFCTTRATSS
mmetsp:Transcript_5095/g.11320  ORF Transcript_5095/g.11320 Transcript_5095/m.11320 type:complete len:209 (+) Transcript_5095:379-1005(+)